MTAPTMTRPDLTTALGRPDALDALDRRDALDPESPLPGSRHLRLADLAAAVGRVQAPLPTELAASRPATGGGLTVLFQAELRAALRAGELERAEEAALALWRRHGHVDPVYALVETLLDQLARERAAGLVSLLEERLAIASAERLVARLHRRTPTPAGEGVVLLVTPTAARRSDSASIALRALAHVVEEAGHPAVVIGDLGGLDLLELATTAGVVGVVWHVSALIQRRELAAMVTAVRAAAPDVRLLVCGPAPARAVPGVDLVTADVAHLVAALTEEAAS